MRVRAAKKNPRKNGQGLPPLPLPKRLPQRPIAPPRRIPPKGR
ncbi:hypothetical protein [Nonomuraea antri]|nr:hypothetical protein [Nonomuraea antri]